MPEITLLLLGLLLVMFGLGFTLGWILRGGRNQREKAAINVSWQDQMSAKKIEHERLAEQNKSLMEQISQYQASKKDADRRAQELSGSLKETFELRDELRRKLKQSRHNVDLAIAQRDKIKSDLDTLTVQNEANASALKDKDQKIFNLSRELESWQNRLPPLMERFRLRDLEAEELEVELQKAQDEVAELKTERPIDETRIDPIEASPLANGMDASNDQYEETVESEALESDAPVASADCSVDEASADSEDEATEPEVDQVETGADSAGAGYLSEATEAEETGITMQDYLNGTVTDADLAELLEDAEEITISAETLDDGAPSADDLQKIKGVGPAIEKTLHRLGIYRFAQIAEMSEYEIDRVARELRGFRSRIYREDWIGQAKMLEAEKPDRLA